MAPLLASALLLATVSLVSAQAKCGMDNLCPRDTPCCSQYGECGTGAYCLGGCDPLSSFSLDSCAPQPVCQDRNLKFTSMDRLIPNTKYLGDASKADFVYSGEPVIYNNQLLLTMPEGSVGTLLASTAYMWYGKTTAKMKTSGGKGVVSAFILLGDTKDEIDFEFVGADLATAQTNYYFQGILNYNNGGNASVPGGNTMTTEHTYEIDWQPNSITWSIDGTEVRKLDKSKTWNSTANRYDFPQTPSRVQLSLWPAGAANNPEGTVNWAGGLIDWDSPYMSNNYYFASFSEVTMQCYDPPSGVNKTGSKEVSYQINAYEGTNSSVAITDKPTILGSFKATGLDMDLGKTTTPTDADDPETTGNVVPGQGSAGTGANGNRGNESDSGSNTSEDSGSGSGTESSSGSAATGFVQGGGNNDGGSNAATSVYGGDEKVLLRGSLFAFGVAVLGMLVL